MIERILTKEDVWGTYDVVTGKITGGMILARGMPKSVESVICPIWGDILPYKSVTVKCKENQLSDVIYWLDYAMGGGCVSDTEVVSPDKIYLRADYQCW